LILKALSEPKRDRKKIKNVVHNGQLAFIDIIKIAKMMKNKSCSIDLKGGINEILGTAKSIGCIINKNN